ncbi:MAG: hypothetical protein ACKOFW_06575 [Planctomycetaceae bacterium]
MLFDTHTNLMWYPDHLSDEFVEFAWEAKRAKMKLSQDVYFAGSDVAANNAFDSRPQQLLEATKDADKVIVFGIKAPFCGINADQELIAQFVKEHSDRFIGWCSVDPNKNRSYAQVQAALALVEVFRDLCFQRSALQTSHVDGEMSGLSVFLILQLSSAARCRSQRLLIEWH